ncbi:hypothetical protein G5B30_07210 [Sphingobacterium sp. SGG-5]|uniref:hypothetical protein n=1 Tax=Sphingobacterium sp. SGG-5 TaxID=2710881 RepID=UPI0013EAFDAA|nr:hypothetical protein [Sphingobacterium sp. SGG-5]NGM61704.1 hypothetical protein [Sphingobacterium sp. SGG-5]
MRRETNNATKRLGLVVAISLVQNNPGMPGEDDDIPYSSQPTEESAGQEPIENLPPEQPDVYPLERDEETDIDEIEENEPMESPEIDEIERPEPDIEEINPDRDPEIDTGYGEEE